MKTINEIQDHEWLLDERNDSQIYASDLKHEWNSLSVDERSDWRTLKKEQSNYRLNLSWIGYMNIWNKTDMKTCLFFCGMTRLKNLNNECKGYLMKFLNFQVRKSMTLMKISIHLWIWRRNNNAPYNIFKPWRNIKI